MPASVDNSNSGQSVDSGFDAPSSVLSIGSQAPSSVLSAGSKAPS